MLDIGKHIGLLFFYCALNISINVYIKLLIRGKNKETIEGKVGK